MDKIGKLSQTTFELFGQVITINHNMVIMTYVVIVFLVVISFISTRKLRLILGHFKIWSKLYLILLKTLQLVRWAIKMVKSLFHFIFSILYLY